MSQDNNNVNFNIKEENIEQSESELKEEVEKEFTQQSSSINSQDNFITLNAKICHETSCGMLVISVNYNNKSFIGTLLDTSKYSYSVPIPENQISFSNSKNSNLQNSKQISNLNNLDNECKSAFSDGRGQRKLKGRSLRSNNNSTSPSSFILNERKTRRSLLANDDKCKKVKSNDSDNNSENFDVGSTKIENLPGNKPFNNGKRKYKIKGNVDGDECKTSDCEKVNSPKQKERKYKRNPITSKTPKKQLTKPEKSKKKSNSNHNSSDEESKKVKKKAKGRPSSRQATKKTITYYQNSDEFGDDEVASHFNMDDSINFTNKDSKKNSRGSRRNSYSVIGVKVKNGEKTKGDKKSRPLSTISGQKRKGMNKINNISKKLLTDPTPDNTSIHESVPGSPKQDSTNFQMTVHSSEPRLEQNNININASYLNSSVINRGISPAYSDISENEPLIMQSLDQKSDLHSRCLEKRDYDLLTVGSSIDGINTKAQFKPDHSIFEQKPLDIKPSIPPPPKLISRQVLGTNFASNVAVPMPIKPDIYGNKNKRIFVPHNGNGKTDKRD